MLKLTFTNRANKFSENSKLSGLERDPRIFNAYTHERFFAYEEAPLSWSRLPASLDKFSGIDEMLSANITQLTYRTRQD